MPKKSQKTNAGEAALAFQLKAYGIAFEREFRFHPTRRWRADFYLPEHKMLVEVEGGLWLKKGGHNTAQGIMRDMEKANAAQELGYRVIRVTPAQVKSGRAIIEIKRIIGLE